MKTQAEQLLEEGRPYLAIAESGDAKIAAYEKLAEKIIAAREADRNLTWEQVGAFYGKGTKWGLTLVKWHQGFPEKTGVSLPFSRTEGADDPRRRYEQRQVPTRHDDKVEMLETLLEDPKVAKAAVEKTMKKKGPARQAIKAAVSKANAEERKQEEARKPKAGGLPLPAFVSRMVTKMSDWTLGIAGLRSEFADEIADLPESRERELAAEAAYALADEARAFGDDLSGKVKKMDHPFIEARSAA